MGGGPLWCRCFIDSFCSKDRRTESNLFVAGDALSHFRSVLISEFGYVPLFLLAGAASLLASPWAICVCHTAPLRLKEHMGFKNTLKGLQGTLFVL